jgi:bifunctional non-homologous end joining protein LigD
MGGPKEKSSRVRIGQRELQLSNLQKVFYPKTGFTKGQVIDYYVRISEVLLPHLKGRPLTMKRYPNGVEGQFFYEKRCPAHRPDWVKTAPILSERKGEAIDFCLAEDLPTLVWAANLADLELHTSLSLAKDIQCPTVVAFDLDPGPPADVVLCCRVALELKKAIEGLGLSLFPKTSGSKGLQVYLPLNTPTRYEETKPFAKMVAQVLEEKHPKWVVSEMKKSLREGKVFVDWSQNDDKKTTVNVYSLRAMERPTVSTPLQWKEVEATAKDGKKERLVFEAEDVLARVKKHGDLFEPVLKLKQRLPK